MQLQTGHMQLNQHLYNISAMATPICPVCHKKEETVSYYLLSCTAHAKHHQVQINTLQRDALSNSKLLSNPTCIPHILGYVEVTWRFQPPPSSPPTPKLHNCCYSLSKCIYSDAEVAEQELGASEIGHHRPVDICVGTCQSLM